MAMEITLDITGTWKFNEALISSGMTYIQAPFTTTTMNGTVHSATRIYLRAGTMAYYIGGVFVPVYDAYGWVDEGYRVITVTDTGTADRQFATWFANNATEYVPGVATISYNDEALGKIDVGENITLLTSWKLMEDEVVVEVEDGYAVPSGTLEITEYGIYDITNYASVTVNLEGSSSDVQESASGSPAVTICYNGATLVSLFSGENVTMHTSEKQMKADIVIEVNSGCIIPRGVLEINDDGTYDVAEYSSVNVAPALDADLIESLIDFEYTNNGDGTATLTAWKGTLHGVISTEIVIPDDSRIIL